MHESWKSFLKNEFEKPYFKELSEFLHNEYETKTIYPSVAEAKRQTKINHIDQVCRGERNYAGKINGKKLHWKYI